MNTDEGWMSGGVEGTRVASGRAVQRGSPPTGPGDDGLRQRYVTLSAGWCRAKPLTYGRAAAGLTGATGFGLPLARN